MEKRKLVASVIVGKYVHCTHLSHLNMYIT